MMNQDVWFSVLSEGYAFHKNADPPFDPGVTLITTAGANATITVTRDQVCVSLFRGFLVLRLSSSQGGGTSC